MTACMELALTRRGPVYLRMGKADLGAVHPDSPRLDWGKLLRIQRGDGSLAWIATGSMVNTATAVAARWPGSEVYSAACIKPLEVDHVSDICRRHRAAVV